ncbi:MAG: hypothetical protein V3571_03295 [Pseudodesulfovibrio sp.]
MPAPVLALLLAAALLLPAAPASALSFEQAAQRPDVAAKYLIYLHGAIVETQGKTAVSPRYGVYHYDDIVKHFETRGLTVIEEVRGNVNPNRYAARVTDEVRRLMAGGVPAGSITVAGFSKGGLIALLVASSLGIPELRFAILAGCSRGLRNGPFEQFLRTKRGARLSGRVLSVYAVGDLEAGSCSAAAGQHAGPGLTFREMTLRSNRGHGLFYVALPQWADPVAAFALGGE